MLVKLLPASRLKALWIVLAIVSMASNAHAHPMGNFSVNHYSHLELEGEQIVVRYAIDLAEIPTYQELQQAGIAASGDRPESQIDPNAAAVKGFVAARGLELGRGIKLMVDGTLVPLRMVSSGVIFPAGAGGLPTMKMGFIYRASYPSGVDRRQVRIHYVDGNYQGHSGWKEVVASSSSGALIRSTVPTTDRSAELTNYPTDLLSSPPQDLEASIEASLPALPATGSEGEATRSRARSEQSPPAPSDLSTGDRLKKGKASGDLVRRPETTVQAATGSASVAPSPMQLKANQQQTPRNKFTELITAQHLSLWFLVMAACIAVGLGALHALEPGHGKTIVAAYLVGSRGTARHAVLLGMIVTASHTAGVFALGALTLYASRYIVPEQLYPWLGVFSGVTIAVMGSYMFLRRWTGTASDHSHAPGRAHLHWPFSPKVATSETQTAAGNDEVDTKKVSLGQLFTLGITGGIVPCPAALIVLLSAFALHRIALGFFLIVAFSFGLAAVLIAFGMAMVYARRLMVQLRMDGPITTRWLPLASSAFITVLGAGLAWQAFATTNLHLAALSKEHLGPLLFVTGLGLILGMRHSTDADHVVAISTIVSKQRSIRSAAVIGSVWGLGHTITIFVVGSLIILFGVEIPPRLGLSMEFSVAVMLILLGILNLTGVMQKITSRLTPNKRKSAELSTESRPQNEARLRESISSLGVYQCVRPLVIGLVHGLAGSAAVALLVLSTIHNPYWASVYLVIFGIGTTIGMMCMTAAMAAPLAYAGARFARLSRYIGVVSGMVSVCFGSFLVYQLGFVGGLFTSHPQWTPQ